MHPDLSSMNGEELLREFIILNKVKEHLEGLLIYNSNLQLNMDKVNMELKRIQGRLFFKYHRLNKVDLNSLANLDNVQERLIKYLDL